MDQEIINHIKNFTLQESNIPANFDVEELHPIYQTRYVDFAAQAGNFNALKFLVINYNASLFQKPNAPKTHLLYWALSCNDIEKRKTILNWIIEDTRYQQLNCNITPPRHIEALRNPNFIPSPGDITDSLGLSPSVYFVLGNDAVSDTDKIKFINIHIHYFIPPVQGYYKGVNFLYIIADNTNLFNLPVTQDYDIPFDLNARRKSHLDKGKSLAWILAFKGQWDLLNKLVDRLPPGVWVDLNANLEHEFHPEQGKSLAWILAAKNQWDLFNKLVDRLPPGVWVDLNAKAHTNDPNKNKSLATILIEKKQYNLLNQLAVRNNYSINLNQNMINALIENDQSVLLLNILTHTQNKIPLENISAIAKICILAKKQEYREQVFAFLRHYDENELFDVLLNQQEIHDYVRIALIHTESISFSSNEKNLTKEDPEQYAKIFQFFYELKDESLRQEYALQLAQLLSLLKETYKNDPVGLQTILKAHPDIIHHVHSMPAGFNSAQDLSPIKQLEFEYLLLLRTQEREFSLSIVDILKENDTLKTEVQQQNNAQNRGNSTANTAPFLKRKRDEEENEPNGGVEAGTPGISDGKFN